MRHSSIATSTRLCRLALASALVVAGAAQAAIMTPVDPATVADYGKGGNVFDLTPSLFVQGLGNADDPVSVAALNADLQFAAPVVSGWGSNLLTIDYRLHNAGSSSFGPLRFMVSTNPDGDSVEYLDMLSQTWGAAAAGDPTLREGRAFTDNPFDTITARFRSTNQLNEGLSALDAACTLPAGCDAVIGLQWDAPTLGPGETFRIVVGLSDNGQHLSSRWVDATAVNSVDTVLTLSGVSSIVPVPEPATVAMLAAGLAMLGIAARRRVRD